MDGKQSRELTQILNAIEEGGFGKDELVQRLNALVDHELSQTERSADMELVQACQDILYRLHHQGEEYVSSCSTSLAKAQKKLNKPRFSLPSFSPAARIAAIFIILLGGGLLFDLFISGDYLFGLPSPDDQQYIVAGTDIDSIVAQEVEAEQNIGMKILSTSSWEAAIDAYGSAPPIPEWLPEGWDPLDYYVVISKRAERLNIQYEKSDEHEYIKYSITRYIDAESAQKEFEQNSTGLKLQISGNSVYLTVNTGSCVAVWLVNNTCYSVTGPISENDISQIIESIR